MKVSLVFLLGLLAAVAVIVAGETKEEPALVFLGDFDKAIDKLFGHAATDDDPSKDYDSSEIIEQSRQAAPNQPGFFFWHPHHRHGSRCPYRRTTTSTTTSTTTTTTTPSTTAATTTTTTTPAPGP